MAFATTDQHASGMSASLVEREKARPLHGMKAIGAYMGKSANTVRQYIEKEGLPAAKIGGEWVSDEGRIDTWRLSRIG
jgi:hypothetical protein